MTEDRNCLSYWFPKVVAAGLPVPKTRILSFEGDLLQMLDGNPDAGTLEKFNQFIHGLHALARYDLGGVPVFLRTGHTSGKHRWDQTCYVTDLDRLPHHVMALVEHSACADLFGLPTKVWAVRKFLQLKSAFTAFRQGMPIAREFRFFVEDGRVVCWHPYWPAGAIENGRPSDPDWRKMLEVMNELGERRRGVLGELIARFQGVLDGAWSVDFAEDVHDEWWLIDMAQARESWHWPDCPEAGRFCTRENTT